MVGTSSLSNLTMTSPACMPPLAAGPSGVTAATSAPVFSGTPSAPAISSVTVWIFTPSQPAPHLVVLAELLHDRLQPCRPAPRSRCRWSPPVGEMMAVFTPTTSPSMLNSGPPELPLLIEASVCR